MKKSLLIVASLFVIQTLFSQTVLTNDINLSLGDTYKYDGYEGVTNIEPGSGGPNQNWDFSQVTGTSVVTGDENICVDPSTTPFADSAAINGSNICVRNIDEDVSPYQFFECNNNNQNLLAMGFVGSGNSNFTTYTNVLRVHEFPFSYGNSYNDSWELLTFYIDFGFYFMRDSATVIVEADAYGSISTPIGEYQNTLRIKRTTTYYSWFKFTEDGEWMQSGPFTDIAYEWYAPNIKIPVMIIDELDGFSDYSVRYLFDFNFTTGILTEKETQVELFPNPTRNIIQVNSDKALHEISVFNLNGQKMMVIPLKGFQSKQIEISELGQGLYLLKVEFEDNSSLTKRIIKQ